MIPVTKPFLPPLEEYKQFLTGIWDRKWLTNMGPLSEELEFELKKKLNINHLLFVNNGTIALQMAIKSLDLVGEIITTPFSFVATTSSIVWEGCKPVFVDIDSKTLNIDPSKIEDAISPNTSAILATHVYGNPCDVIEIEKIAQKHKLKVIYDGAHAFGVSVNEKSVFEYGDISICSLHATKLYHSIEGGLIISQTPEQLNKLKSMRNFGFNGPESFAELGINGKNSEFHAAMGLLNLKYIDKIHNKRKLITERYSNKLNALDARAPIWNKHASLNYAYYPLIFNSEEKMMNCKSLLEKNNIYTRRYFYPSLAKSLPYIKSKDLTVTDNISKKVLCLPLYDDLTNEDIDLISKLILKA